MSCYLFVEGVVMDCLCMYDYLLFLLCGLGFVLVLFISFVVGLKEYCVNLEICVCMVEVCVCMDVVVVVVLDYFCIDVIV